MGIRPGPNGHRLAETRVQESRTIRTMALSIDQDDFDSVPFNQFGGLGKAYELFGDGLAILLDELNQRLAV